MELMDLLDSLDLSIKDIKTIAYDDNKGTRYTCNDLSKIGIKILYDEAISITGFGQFIGAFNFKKYETYRDEHDNEKYIILEDNKLRYLEIYMK